MVLVCTACSLFRMDASMYSPRSVRLLEYTFCHPNLRSKISTSSFQTLLQSFPVGIHQGIYQDCFWQLHWCAWSLPHIFPLHQSRAIPAHFGWWWSCLRFFPVLRYPFNLLFNFSPLTDISHLDHAKTESITNYNTNSKLDVGVSR